MVQAHQQENCGPTATPMVSFEMADLEYRNVGAHRMEAATG